MPLASQKRVGGGLPIGACLADFVAKNRFDLADRRVDWRVSC